MSRLGPKLFAAALIFAACTPGAAFAGDTGTRAGPVWETWHARVDEQKLNDYLRFMSSVYRHELDAWKQAGLISDYKILVSKAQHPDDWNLAIVYQYENMAALDVPDDVWEQVEHTALAKLSGEAKALQKQKTAWRRVIGSRIAREILWEK